MRPPQAVFRVRPCRPGACAAPGRHPDRQRQRIHAERQGRPGAVRRARFRRRRARSSPSAAPAEVAAKAPGARQVDVQGKTVLPGLIDAHGHVFGLGQMLTQLDLSQTHLAAGRPEGDRRLREAPIRARAGCAGAAGTRKTGSWAASRPRSTSMRSSATARSGSSASTATPAGPTAARWRRPASPKDRRTRPAARSCATRTAKPPACWSTRPRSWSTKVLPARPRPKGAPCSTARWARWRASA